MSDQTPLETNQGQTATASPAENLLGLLPHESTPSLPIPRQAHDFVRRHMLQYKVNLQDPDAVATAIPEAVKAYLIHLVKTGDKADVLEGDVAGLVKMASAYISYKEGEGASCKCCCGWLEGTAGHRADCIVGYVYRVFGGKTDPMHDVIVSAEAADTPLSILAEIRSLVDVGDGTSMPVFTDRAAVHLVLSKIDRMTPLNVKDAES